MDFIFHEVKSDIEIISRRQNSLQQFWYFFFNRTKLIKMVFKIEQVLIDHISNEVPGSHGCTIQGGKEVQNANGFLKIQ